MQSEYGDAVQVILVESQGATDEDAQAFALKHKWLGNRAIWTTERPFSTGGNGLPMYALISPTGEVVLTGNTASDHSKISKAVEEMLKKGSSAPTGTADSVAKIYRDLDRGNLAKVVMEAQKVAAKAAGKEPAVEAAAKAVEAAASAKLDRQIARVKWLASNGRLLNAQSAHEALTKSVKGYADFESRTAELSKLFEGPEVQQTLALERELAQMEEELFAEDLKDPLKVAKKLRKFAAESGDSKAGKRAEALAVMAEKAAAIKA
jgi:hypothetical protein